MQEAELAEMDDLEELEDDSGGASTAPPPVLAAPAVASGGGGGSSSDMIGATAEAAHKAAQLDRCKEARAAAFGQAEKAMAQGDSAQATKYVTMVEKLDGCATQASKQTNEQAVATVLECCCCCYCPCLLLLLPLSLSAVAVRRRRLLLVHLFHLRVAIVLPLTKSICCIPTHNTKNAQCDRGDVSAARGAASARLAGAHRAAGRAGAGERERQGPASERREGGANNFTRQCFEPFLAQKGAVYQDRLGTNIGKVDTKRLVFYREPWRRCRRRRGTNTSLLRHVIPKHRAFAKTGSGQP
jgi:hypothetical protein